MVRLYELIVLLAPFSFVGCLKDGKTVLLLMCCVGHLFLKMALLFPCIVLVGMMLMLGKDSRHVHRGSW
jgi:hypothetical protein